MKKTIISLCSLLLLAGCYRDNEQELYPETGQCDTSGVTYTGTVTGLLQQYGCTGCHSGSAPSGNISLDNFNAVKAVAANGKLYGVISHSSGYSPMPKGGGKMNSCDISKIKAWIDAGAVNN